MDINEIKKSIFDLLGQLEELAQQGELSSRIDVGCVLWDISSKAQAALEPLKNHLRDTVEHQCGPVCTTTVEGTGGNRCLVFKQRMGKDRVRFESA